MDSTGNGIIRRAGGCVAGAGTNIAIPQANKEVAGFKKAAKQPIPDKE